MKCTARVMVTSMLQSLLLGLTCFGSNQASATPTPQPPDFQVNSLTSGAQKFPSVAFGQGGSFLVVWANPQIQAQRFDAGGVRLGDQFQINPPTIDYQFYPKIASGPSNEFVVVFPTDLHPHENTDRDPKPDGHADFTSPQPNRHLGYGLTDGDWHRTHLHPQRKRHTNPGRTDGHAHPQPECHRIGWISDGHADPQFDRHPGFRVSDCHPHSRHDPRSPGPGRPPGVAGADAGPGLDRQAPSWSPRPAKASDSQRSKKRERTPTVKSTRHSAFSGRSAFGGNSPETWAGRVWR